MHDYFPYSMINTAVLFIHSVYQIILSLPIRDSSGRFLFHIFFIKCPYPLRLRESRIVILLSSSSSKTKHLVKEP